MDHNADSLGRRLRSCPHPIMSPLVVTRLQIFTDCGLLVLETTMQLGIGEKARAS